MEGTGLLRYSLGVDSSACNETNHHGRTLGCALDGGPGSAVPAAVNSFLKKPSPSLLTLVSEWLCSPQIQTKCKTERKES